MEAQRYDLSKRRKNSQPSILKTAPLGPGDQLLQNGNYFFESPNALFEQSWEDQNAMALLSACTSRSDASSTENDSHNHSDESSASTLTVSTTAQPHKKETQSIDVFERDGYTAVRTIIQARRPSLFHLNILPRQSSPSAMPTRPSSPLGLNLRNLNCACSTDAFEEEIDFIHKEREKEMKGINTAIQIRLEQSCSVVAEERWRRPLEAIVYRRSLDPIQNVVGTVEVD
ncbi:hypothetical protein BDZ97DRAFT_1906841 [Flammula alnicola]|nr:hypothetical protein BDZ97DRAFT_1906841 [Flammula alnicola]